MTYDEVYEVVKQQITKVLPNVSPDMIHADASLKDLGADSVDRADISTMSMEQLGLRLPLVELGKVSSIRGLIELLQGQTR